MFDRCHPLGWLFYLLLAVAVGAAVVVGFALVGAGAADVAGLLVVVAVGVDVVEGDVFGAEDPPPAPTRKGPFPRDGSR